MKYETTITSNGSRWAGDDPASIPDLVAALRKYTLETWTGNPVHKVAPGTVRLFGNFCEYSHVFNITTNDPSVYQLLIGEIRANRARRFAKRRK